MSGTTFATSFSGIGAPEVAWAPLGWTPLWVSEIEPFPAAVLAQRVGVPNLGDARGIAAKLAAGDVEAPDVFIGGSPCQAFSVAGLRQSLNDDCGNLTITFVEIVDAIDDARRVAGRRPSIVCWENVPGVLNVKDNAFGCFLAALVGDDEPLVPDGGKWSDAGLVVGPSRRAAWRVIDAQGFVPQRRRRVFVVATALDGFDPSAVLHEDEADFEFGVAEGWSGWALLPLSARMQRDPAAGGEAREGTAPTLAARTRGGGGLGTDAELDGALIPAARPLDTHLGSEVISGLDASYGKGAGARGPAERPVVLAYGGNNTSGPIDVATARSAHGGPHGRLDFETETFIACATGSVTHTLKADGFDASEDGTGRGQPIINAAWPQDVADPITAHEQRTYTHEGSTFRTRNVVPGQPVYSFKPGQSEAAGGPFITQDYAPTLQAISNGSTAVPAVAFSVEMRGRLEGNVPEGFHPTVNIRASSGGSTNSMVCAPVAFDTYNQDITGQVTHALRDGHSEGTPAVVAPTITSTNDPSRSPQSSEITAQVAAVSSAVSAVRRLTPTECARLQGFPDDWCDIVFRGKPAADGPKYKAFGNSMAVPVITWIGERIAAELGRVDV